MTTYAWKIQSLQSLPEQNGVANVVVRVIATYTATADDGVSATQLVNVMVGTLDTNGFTPFEALTELQVVSWIETALGTDLTDMQAVLEQRIQEARAVALPPPWQ